MSKILQKRHKSLPNPPERTVLAHLVYAALLENSLFEHADSAFTVLENYFIDWNEIRVSTVNELADTFPMLSDPLAAGERVRRTLQGVFEKTYMFDLEELRKKGKNLGQAVEFLNSISGSTRFMVDYTTQVAFGGHVIPLDEASLRIFRLLDLTQVNKEGTRENVAGLERTIHKKNGLMFSLQLHHFAAGFYNDPELTELRSILKSIDSDAENRSWTPPVLTLPKPVAKPPVKPPIPPLAAIPFSTPDDDDFDEEHGGTEVEFISDETVYQHDSSILPEKTETKVVTPSTEKKKTSKQEKTSVKKNTDSVTDLPNSSQTIPQPQEKQLEPVQEKSKKVTKNETNKKTIAPNNKTVAKSDTKTDVKPDTKTEIKTETKTAAETNDNLSVKPETIPVVNSDTKTVVETDDKSNMKPETKSVVKPNTKDGKHTIKSELKTDISKVSHTTSSPKQVVNNHESSSSPSKKKNTETVNEEKKDTKTVKSTIKQLVKKKPK
ncbi:MAG: hypothetical protein LBC20_01615 [Planctomycetaceae bacterium]|nr:hypothetical protein [Planctomycetaceae bacterium]